MSIMLQRNMSGDYRPSRNLQTIIKGLGLGTNLLNISFVIFGAVFYGLNGQKIAQLDFNSLGPIYLSISISIVGAIVISKQPFNPMGWIYSSIGFFQSLSWFSFNYSTYALIVHPGRLPLGGLMSVLSVLIWAPGLSIFLTYAILLYPTGKLASPRWRVVAWASIVPPLLSLFFCLLLLPYGGPGLLDGQVPDVYPKWLESSVNLLFPWMLVCGFASLISLFLRYIHSETVERQQIKWFIYAAVLFFLVLSYQDLVPNSSTPEWLIWILALAGTFIPIATAISILRYHLFDIDLLIRKTLVYSILTITLALIYFGIVILLEALLHFLFGESGQVATVVSTLVIAALFTPVRKQVQEIIDRHFYRSKYDGDRALAAFAQIARDEVDIERLTVGMFAVTQETLHPTNVNVWLSDRRGAKK